MGEAVKQQHETRQASEKKRHSICLKATAPPTFKTRAITQTLCHSRTIGWNAWFQHQKLDKALRPVPESPLRNESARTGFSDDFVTEVTDDQVMSWCNEHAITVPTHRELHAIVLSLARRHIVARSRLAVLKVIADPRCANRRSGSCNKAARQNTQPPSCMKKAGRQPTARNHGKLAYNR